MFSILSVRSATEDRTARAIIRDEALRLFAGEGPERVSMRQIAQAAGVSPALVVHHYGSKEGLQTAVDDYMVRVVEFLLKEVTTRAKEGLYDNGPQEVGSLAEAMAKILPPGSAVPAYLRRLLVSKSDAAKEVFGRLYQLAIATVSSLVAAGEASTGDDASVRAALLMANDLAVLLLRDRLAEVLGFDPLSREGMRRWGRQVASIYGGGLRA